MSTLTLAEPLTATVLGVIVLHEQLSAGAATGLLVLASGIVLLAVASGRRMPRGGAAPAVGDPPGAAFGSRADVGGAA